jgi:hypothetical protein
MAVMARIVDLDDYNAYYQVDTKGTKDTKDDKVISGSMSRGAGNDSVNYVRMVDNFFDVTANLTINVVTDRETIDSSCFIRYDGRLWVPLSINSYVSASSSTAVDGGKSYAMYMVPAGATITVESNCKSFKDLRSYMRGKESGAFVKSKSSGYTPGSNISLIDEGYDTQFKSSSRGYTLASVLMTQRQNFLKDSSDRIRKEGNLGDVALLSGMDNIFLYMEGTDLYGCLYKYMTQEVGDITVGLNADDWGKLGVSIEVNERTNFMQYTGNAAFPQVPISYREHVRSFFGRTITVKTNYAGFTVFMTYKMDIPGGYFGGNVVRAMLYKRTFTPTSNPMFTYVFGVLDG